MKTRAIIVEDEPRSARYLSRQLEREGIDCIQILNSVEEALVWFESNEHPDIVFSDIELGDGLSFDIYNQIELKSKLIFTTAYDQYSIQAFKHNSIDYLLKPIKSSDLIFALNQYRKGEKKIIPIQNIEGASYKNVFLHKAGQHLRTIRVADIAYVYSENKLVYFILKNKDKIITDFTLESLSKNLDPKYFYQINRQMIIHQQSIVDILVLSSTRYELKLNPDFDSSILISRNRIPEFKSWLER